MKIAVYILSFFLALSIGGLVYVIFFDEKNKIAKVNSLKRQLDKAVIDANEAKRVYEWSLDNKTEIEIQGFRDALNEAYSLIEELTEKLAQAKDKLNGSCN